MSTAFGTVVVERLLIVVAVMVIDGYAGLNSRK